MESKYIEARRHELSFDRIIKNTLAESDEMTIRFINGLLDDNIPLDATVEWLDKESRGNSKNTGIVADFYPKIADRLYAIEIEQDSRSGEMALRVFKYAVGGAVLHGSSSTKAKLSIAFPQPCVVYLKSTRSTPRELEWGIDFYDGQKITLKVPVIRLSQFSIREISQRNLLPIGQFYLRTFEKLTMKKVGRFQEALTELLEEISAAVDKDLIPRNVGAQMRDTVVETAENIVKKSGLDEEVQVKMHSNITDTYTWTDYREYYEKREESAKAEGKAEGIAEGENAKAVAIAENALSMSIPVADIAKMTGLSVAEVEALENKAVQAMPSATPKVPN